MGYQVTLIFLMALSNFLTRAIPIGLLSGKKLPKVVTTWLRYVPVPVLSAMLAADLFIREGELAFKPSNAYLWVAVPALMVAYKSKNMFLTVLSGMAILAGLRWLSPGF